jgi:hypothetical protein
MSTTSRFSTHHVPDDGTWYTEGEIVRLDRSSTQARIIKDPVGDHEVHSCRRATEYTGGPPLLRVGLKRANRASADAPVGQPVLLTRGRHVRWGDPI